jgi:pimeloyl-ACP methyl ester carboxylesterase
MPLTVVVFVHGFISSPAVWQPFTKRLQTDADFPADRFRFLTFAYPTRFLDLSPGRRIPSIRECGDELAGYLKLNCADATSIFLVGHSMGGLVIEAMIASKLAGKAMDLQNIAGVIQFATPNRGSNMLSDTRSILTKIFGRQPQDEGLRTLSDDTDSVLRDIDRGVLRSTSLTKYTCPIAFQIFYGLEDNIVPEVSARGPFDDAIALPGDHSSILNGGIDRKDDPNDLRYGHLKDALLNPLGHPSIYEITSFEVSVAVQPVSKEISFQIPNLDRPVSVQTDNIAVRTITFKFSDKNRCHTPYKQVYRSVNGYVEFLTTSSENEASSIDKSTYRSEGKIFTYVFTPDHNDTFSMRLRIYNGFGDGNRSWHNHMERNAHYQSMTVNLDLSKYEAEGYTITREPRFCYLPGDSEDHELCAQREFSDSLLQSPSSSTWKRTWELKDVRGGIIDLVWDVKPPAA